MSFEYNSSGLRTKKVVGDKTIEYYYSGALLVAQFDGTTWVRFIYAPNGEAIGFTYGAIDENGQISIDDYCYYVKNVQGDVTGFYSLFLSIFREYTYDAWGNITGVYNENGNPVTNTNDAAFLNPLRYRGYYYDDETGLYYLNSRYYNPEWGRFICADGYLSTGQGLLSTNMYAYCLNNPVNYSDPSGTSAVCYNCFESYIFSHNCTVNVPSAYMLSEGHRKLYYPNSASTSTTSVSSNSSASSSSSGGVGVKSFTDDFFNNYAYSYADQYIHSFLPTPYKSSIGSSGKWINTLDDFSKSVGIVTFVFTIEEILWDIDYYYGDAKKQAIAVSIDIVSVVVSTSVTGAVVTATDGYGIFFSAGISAFIEGGFDLLKDDMLG